MSSDTWIGKKGFRYFYYRFRDSQYYGLAIVGFTVLICVVLIFRIIMPEVSQWLSIRDEVIATQQQIETLQQNINFINNLDKNTLDSQLQTVSHALPPDKNFSYELIALSNAAAASGVSLSDYAFQLGTLASIPGGPTKGVQQNGLSQIQITVTVNGTIDEVKHFISSLDQNLPVSEVTDINGSGRSISVRIQFYQKPFSNVAFSADTPIQSLSPQKIQLLQNLSKWDNLNTNQNFSAQSGSNSAIPLF